jgi:hypothetical protein
MTSPAMQFLPTEVATAGGRQYLGVDPADVDEVVAFYDTSNPLVQAYGVTVKFNKPFRAVNIPQHARATATLSEFNGKKYLQCMTPPWPSFYGPNNKTLVMAPDAILRQIIPASTEPKTGPLLDRLRDVPAGSDVYAAVNVASLRGLLPIIMGSAGQAIPKEVNALLEGITAAELTLNLATRGPISMVVHCNDEAAAQQLEMFLLAIRQNAVAPTPDALRDVRGQPLPGAEQPGAGQPGANDWIKQAMLQYQERMNQRYQPQRNGASVTLVRIEADDPIQPQLLGMVIGGLAGPAMQAAQKSFGLPGGPNVAGPPAGPDGLAVPSADPTSEPGAVAEPTSPDADRR